MFRVSVIYRDEPGKQFDSEYYLGSHARLVKEKLSPLGLLRFEVDGGAGQPPAFPIKADMLFESAEAFESAMGEVGEVLMADVPNFTDMESTLQFSEVLLSE